MQMQSRWLRLPLCAILLSVLSLSITNCGLSEEGPGGLFVDPGKYALYGCNDLALERTKLIAREKDLRAQIRRADESAAGAVIGSLAYRSDYESVLTEEKLVQRKAEDKKCSFAFGPDYQSDHTIH